MSLSCFAQWTIQRLIYILGTDLQLIISSVLEMSIYNEYNLQSLIPGWCVQSKYFSNPILLLIENAAFIIKLIIPIYSIYEKCLIFTKIY